MLENCRVNKGEKKDDEALARKIAALCDVYVNDAFGTAHRAEATTHGVARFAKVACAGPLMAAELDALGKALAQSGAAAGGDRRRLEGLHQAHHPRRAGEEGRQPDRRRRHRQYLPARRRQADRQVARRARTSSARRSRSTGGDAGAAARPTWWWRRLSARRARARSRRWTTSRADEMILDIGPETAQGAGRVAGEGRHHRLERPGRRVRERRLRQRHRGAGAGHRRVEGVLASPAAATRSPRSTSSASPSASTTSRPPAARSSSSSRARRCPPSRRSKRGRMVKQLSFSHARAGAARHHRARWPRAVREAKVGDGLCTVFVRHTSASLVIQENADPTAKSDLERWLNRLVPEGDPFYRHDTEGPGRHAGAHQGRRSPPPRFPSRCLRGGSGWEPGRASTCGSTGAAAASARCWCTSRREALLRRSSARRPARSSIASMRAG